MHNYYSGSKSFPEELSPMEKAGKNKIAKLLPLKVKVCPLA